MTDPYGYYSFGACKRDVERFKSSFLLLCDYLLVNKVIGKRSYNKILKGLGYVVPRVSAGKEKQSKQPSA